MVTQTFRKEGGRRSQVEVGVYIDKIGEPHFDQSAALTTILFVYSGASYRGKIAYVK